jgi:hypothetical protein
MRKSLLILGLLISLGAPLAGAQTQPDQRDPNQYRSAYPEHHEYGDYGLFGLFGLLGLLGLRGLLGHRPSASDYDTVRGQVRRT